jgi:hypothetical protein
MMDILNLISGTPLPTILVIGGMLFIALALGSQIGGRIEMPAERQRISGVIGGVLLVAGLAFYFLPSVISPQISQTDNPSSGAAQSNDGGLTESNTTGLTSSLRKGCFETYFAGILDDRLASLETGAMDQVIINPAQTKSEPFAIQLTRNREIVGAMIINFFPESTLFKITSVVNPECVVVTSYENATMGGDPNTLGNWNTLELRLGGLLYIIDFDYSSGEIKGNFEFVTE